MARRLLFLWLVFAAGLAQAQTRISDVIYLKSGGAAFTMDVFVPAHPTGKGVIYLVSGGYWSDHSQINPAIAKPFNDRGMTVFEVVHGAGPRYHVPEIVAMLQRAVRFIRTDAKRFQIDPNEIGIWGMSSGGHLSLMVAATGAPGDPNAKDPVDQASSAVNAVVAFAPPTDLLNWGSPGRSAFHVQNLAVFMPAFGVNPQTPEDDVNKLGHMLSPVERVTASFPPTLLIHGDKDELVPFQQSQEMDAALAKAGVPHKLIAATGYGHDAAMIGVKLQDMLDWFDAHLKK